MLDFLKPGRLDRRAADAEGDPGVDLTRALVAGVVLPADAVRALPRLLTELPGAVHDLRLLLRNLTRLTEHEGELTALLREQALLAAARSIDIEKEAARARPGSGPARAKSQNARGAGSASSRARRRG